MKKKIFRKAVSFTAAAAIGCTSLIGMGFAFQAFAEEETNPALSAESEMVLAESIKPGLYINNYGIHEFREDMVYFLDFTEGAIRPSSYTLSDGIMQSSDGKVMKVEQIDENTICLHFQDEDFDEMMYYMGEGSVEEMHLYPMQQIGRRIRDIAINTLGCENPSVSTKQENQIITFSIFNTKDEPAIGYYTVDILTGEVLEMTEGFPALSPITVDDFTKNKILTCVSGGNAFYFDFDSGKVFSQENSEEQEIHNTVTKGKLTFSINPFDGTENPVTFQEYSFRNETTAVFTLPDGTQMTFTATEKPEAFEFYDNQELASMAKDYYQSQSGDYAGEPQITVNEDATVTIQMTETESYTVNPFTGTGFNQAQEEIDLTSGQPEIVLAESFKPGLYINDFGIRQITEDTIAYIAFGDGHWQDTPYTLENGILTTKNDVCQVQQTGENTFLLIFTTRDFTEPMTYIGEGSLEDYHVYSTLEVVKRVKDVVENVLGYDSSRLVNTYNNNILTLSVFGTKDGQEENLGYYKLDIFTGEVLESTEGLPDLSPITFNDFEKDKVLMYVSDGKIYYLDFHSGKMISQEDGTEIPASYAVNKATLQFSMNPFDGTETAVNCQNYSFPNASTAVLTAQMKDETIQEIVLKPAGTYDTFKFYNHQELA
ncbi:MAG: hypothetical protein IKI37_03645, partial [Oscillospiraceae bacterium]|nr:hypothetical protein [Oscillospiraceae bacterium]